MLSRSFERFGGLLAILAGVCGFAYAVEFVILRDNLLSALFLTLAGFLAAPPAARNCIIVCARLTPPLHCGRSCLD